jgi:hypothetical protein
MATRSGADTLLTGRWSSSSRRTTEQGARIPAQEGIAQMRAARSFDERAYVQSIEKAGSAVPR